MQHSDRVQLQHPTPQLQDEAGSRYNVPLISSSIPPWHKVTRRIAALNLFWTIVLTTLTRVYRGKAKVSNRFKLIHYYLGVLPSSSCQEDSKVMSSETSQETMQPRSLLDKRRTEGGEPSQGIQPGTIGLSRTTCSCCRGRTLAKETGPRLNHTKLEDTLAVVIKVANCIARLKIKDITCVF